MIEHPAWIAMRRLSASKNSSIQSIIPKHRSSSPSDQDHPAIFRAEGSPTDRLIPAACAGIPSRHSLDSVNAETISIRISMTTQRRSLCRTRLHRGYCCRPADRSRPCRSTRVFAEARPLIWVLEASTELLPRSAAAGRTHLRCARPRALRCLDAFAGRGRSYGKGNKCV